jgi:hypothetical protein
MQLGGTQGQMHEIPVLYSYTTLFMEHLVLLTFSDETRCYPM